MRGPASAGKGARHQMENRRRTRCEVYSRVVGFLTPVSQWNKGKREEFRDRRTFDRVLERADKTLQH